MNQKGTIRKMRSEMDNPVRYFLPVGEVEVYMNECLGKHLRLQYLGEIHCIRCGRKTSKSFAQGYCYPCFTTAPETEDCVLRPELCQAHEGIARDLEYAKEHCLIEQVVYLSLTSNLKVGVTRNTQVPTRWIEQGAVRAIELARTPNRYLAGQIEVRLKAFIKDKTNWRAMLKNEVPDIDLLSSKHEIAKKVSPEWSQYLSGDNTIYSFQYPVNDYPEKVGSMNFDKEPVVEGVLTGIKGQYLMFDSNKVLNARKFGGYSVRITVSD
jgi:hypothetical protein